MLPYQLPEDQDYIEVQYADEQLDDWDDAGQGGKEPSTPRQSKRSPSSSTHSVKSGSKGKGSRPTTVESGSDTEKEPSKMASSRSSRHSSSSRKDKSSSSSKVKKTDNWAEVTEPDERRRIQNRIAQRKFREKAREQKDRAQREAQNQQFAGSAYHIPDPDDFSLLDDSGDLSGLPWGGISMRHVVTRGHASASAGQHTLSHHSGTNVSTPGPAAGPVDQALYNLNPYGGYPAHNSSMSGGAGDVYYDSPYAGGYYDFDPAGAGDGHHHHHHHHHQM
ncbi:hypothetical protein C8A03DRAFT_13205 [Achaetomium macrosporum]|uniref:BZIP domain-containing protein n=1 Tax=Achaetomium macrosporum TaxID=79813 RepID=A0AAN7H8V5_9PEZI|nr:hypothetical protein C8A03DRAFT_13205 [Achaetomium macrosporum]